MQCISIVSEKNGDIYSNTRGEIKIVLASCGCDGLKIDLYMGKVSPRFKEKLLEHFLLAS